MNFASPKMEQSTHPRYLFRAGVTRTTERGVYAASAWDNPGDVAELSTARKLRTMKRPEGRAPALILVGMLHLPRERVRVKGKADRLRNFLEPFVADKV